MYCHLLLPEYLYIHPKASKPIYSPSGSGIWIDQRWQRFVLPTRELIVRQNLWRHLSTELTSRFLQDDHLWKADYLHDRREPVSALVGIVGSKPQRTAASVTHRMKCLAALRARPNCPVTLHTKHSTEYIYQTQGRYSLKGLIGQQRGGTVNAKGTGIECSNHPSKCRK